tara:strand:- start:428 stop:1006 length:579 start_codon:yes stop_codon:yes gene_type:complete
MQGLFNFIIKPKGKRYNNSNDNLILNTNISNHLNVNRQAIVLATPKAIKTNIKKGDEIIVHHNVFREWYNANGKRSNSGNYINDELYHCNLDQIYLYKVNKKWVAVDGYCFVYPIINKDKFKNSIEKPNVGIVRYTDGVFNKGDLVGFRPNIEHEFIIDNELLYKINNNFISIKYEYQGDEKKYNPSWAKSS